MAGFATPVEYQASDGPDSHCKFDSLAKFIGGFWRFIYCAPYNGWRNHAESSEDFIRYIGPIYTPTHLYAETVLNLVPSAMALAAEVAGNVPAGPPPGTSEPYPKPPIKQFIQSPNYNSRNGDRPPHRPALHHQPERRRHDLRVSIAKVASLGALRDRAKRRHLPRCAMPTPPGMPVRRTPSSSASSTARHRRLATPPQEASLIALLRSLVGTYKLRWGQVDGHRFTPGISAPPIARTICSAMLPRTPCATG